MKLPRTLVGVVGASLALVALSFSSGQVAQARSRAHTLPGGYKHLVVIYEENHSFDNLYGGWGSVNGQRVDGPRQASRHGHSTQVAQDGTPYGCLLQNDVNLTSPAAARRPARTPAHGVAASHFRNQPVPHRRLHQARGQDLPGARRLRAQRRAQGLAGRLPGGCTRDLVHRFYQEQYQLDGGKQDRYVTGSDAVGLTMGHYDTKQLPIYRYLHSQGRPALRDRRPVLPGGLRRVVPQPPVPGRRPGARSTPAPASRRRRDALACSTPTACPTQRTRCTRRPAGRGQGRAADPGLRHRATSDPVKACGDFAVNTIQPASPPPAATGAKLPLIDDTAYPNIGDRLTDAGVSWNWYSGGWKRGGRGHPGPLFQYHHQPLNYFADYAPAQPGRTHLKDETRLHGRRCTHGTLPKVSFVKPYGAENEHPGYASEPNGSDHLVDLLKKISQRPAGRRARSWSSPTTSSAASGTTCRPRAAASKTPGVHDAWGPGTRIPALVLSTSLRRSGVDHTSTTPRRSWPRSSAASSWRRCRTRDAAVNDLRHAVAVGGR